MPTFSLQVWDFETIDNADITEDNTVFEMEPLMEIKVCHPSPPPPLLPPPLTLPPTASRWAVMLV